MLRNVRSYPQILSINSDVQDVISKHAHMLLLTETLGEMQKYISLIHSDSYKNMAIGSEEMTAKCFLTGNDWIERRHVCELAHIGFYHEINGETCRMLSYLIFDTLKGQYKEYWQTDYHPNWYR